MTIYNPRQKSLKHPFPLCNVEMTFHRFTGYDNNVEMLRWHFTVSLATTLQREGDGSGARMFKVFQGLCLRLSELAGRVLSMRRRWKVLRDGNGTDEPHSLPLVFVFYRILYPYFSVENRFEQEITYNSNEFSTTASMPSWNSAFSQRLTLTCNKVRLSTDQLLLW